MGSSFRSHLINIVHFLVAIAVNSSLSISEIVKAKDYSLVEAARPAFGKFSIYFTVGIAIVAPTFPILIIF